MSNMWLSIVRYYKIYLRGSISRCDAYFHWWSAIVCPSRTHINKNGLYQEHSRAHTQTNTHILQLDIYKQQQQQHNKHKKRTHKSKTWLKKINTQTSMELETKILFTLYNLFISLFCGFLNMLPQIIRSKSFHFGIYLDGTVWHFGICNI